MTMAIQELSIEMNAGQLVEAINVNLGEIGSAQSVSIEDSATDVVELLNSVFDGISGVVLLSADDNAEDFIDALNGNFSAAEGGAVRDFEDLIEYENPNAKTSKMVPVYKGDKVWLLTRNSGSPAMPGNKTHYEFYDTNKENPTSVHNVGAYVVPKDGYITIGNNSMPMSNLVSNGIICSRSRSRCYENPAYRWILFGDSISILTYSHTYERDVSAGYSWVCGEANHEVSVTNRAVSGTGILTTDGVSQQVVATNFAPYDVCSILIGTNDWAYNNRGSAFKSSYADVLDSILAAKPTIKIFICTLLQRGDRNDSAEMCTTQNAAIYELGEEYNIPVLDLTDCGLDLRIPEQQALYSRPNGDGTYDKLHPTQEAHELFLAPLFKVKLMKVLNDYTLFPEVLNLPDFEDI